MSFDAWQRHGALGILMLENGKPPRGPAPGSGSMEDPAIYDRPVIMEAVEGAWAKRVMPGDPSLDAACVAAARRLVDGGAVAISSDCGFFIRHQDAVAASVSVPVALSSLLFAPTMLRILPRVAKLAVVTADSTLCGCETIGVADPADQARIVVGGIEGGKLLRYWLAHPGTATDVSALEVEVAACVSQLRAAHREIGAILFECTRFPAVAPTIRRLTGLPVYDSIDLCRMMLASIGRPATGASPADH